MLVYCVVALTSSLGNNEGTSQQFNHPDGLRAARSSRRLSHMFGVWNYTSFTLKLRCSCPRSASPRGSRYRSSMLTSKLRSGRGSTRPSLNIWRANTRDLCRRRHHKSRQCLAPKLQHVCLPLNEPQLAEQFIQPGRADARRLIQARWAYAATIHS